MGTESAGVRAATLLLAGAAELLELLPTPLVLVEPMTGGMLWANEAATRMAGGPLDADADPSAWQRLQRVYAPDGRRLLPHELPAVRVARGERLGNVQVDWDTAAGRRSILVSGAIVTPAEGERVGVITFEDVTELEQVRRRAAVLVEASGALAQSLDYAQTLKTVRRLVVPRFADWCFVELRQPGGTIERSLIAHVDPAREELAREYDRRWPLDADATFGSPQVIRTGVPQLMSEIPDGFWQVVAQDPEQLRILEGIGFCSAMIVPLRVRGEVFGDIALAVAESDRRYAPEDLEAAQLLADRCALALDSARLVTELRARGEELHGILEGVADSVTAQGVDGTLVYANEAAVRTLGFASAEALLAAPVGEILSHWEMLTPEGDPFPLDLLPGRRALAGEEPEPVTVRFRARDGGAMRWSRVKARPVRDDTGHVRLAINVIEDITEIKEAEEAQRFLAEASRVLASSLDYERTLQTTARLAVPEIADWCGVDLAGENGDIQNVAVAHVDPDKIAIAERFRSEYPTEPESPTGVPNVLRTGRAELYPEITDEMLVGAAIDERHLELIRSLGMVSVMIVPMRVRKRTIGAISFVSAESGRRFDAGDLALAEDLGLRAAAAVDNARLYSTRSAIAQVLQASLLPPILPELPGVDVAAVYRAAGEGYEVGGDFYDVFSVSEEHWFAVIGDVQGKGAEAAAITALARYTIRAAAVRLRSPAAILRWLSDVMLRQQGADPRFCTIACVHLDCSRSPVRLTVACGGHPLPLVLRADGEVKEVGASGTLLGLVPQPELQDRSADLHPGDALLLYTDGLTEARAPGRVWTPDELAAALAAAAGRPPQGIVDHLAAEAVPEGAAGVRDDLALVALRAR
jgi:PAS domain S-box-containing protein